VLPSVPQQQRNNAEERNGVGIQNGAGRPEKTVDELKLLGSEGWEAVSVWAGGLQRRSVCLRCGAAEKFEKLFKVEGLVEDR